MTAAALNSASHAPVHTAVNPVHLSCFRQYALLTPLYPLNTGIRNASLNKPRVWPLRDRYFWRFVPYIMRLLSERCRRRTSLDRLHQHSSSLPCDTHIHGWRGGYLQRLPDGTAGTKLGYAADQFRVGSSSGAMVTRIFGDVGCIDKSNSVELQEAINSMFLLVPMMRRNAGVYLADVSCPAGFGQQQIWSAAESESAGGPLVDTLQELIAPLTVEFFWKNVPIWGAGDP